MVLLALLALAVGMSNSVNPRPLETHEVFVAQTAREMLGRGEWVLPTFNGEPRLNKPPLAYWLVMGLEKAAPSSPPVPEWKARFPSAAAGVVVVLAAAAIGKALFGPGTGVLAGLLLCGLSGFFSYANNARPEMLYAACCALMVLGLVHAWRSVDHSRPQRWWALLVWAGAGLAILAKGPHFPAMILGGLVLHAVLDGNARRLWPVLRPFIGVPVMLAISAPWPIAVAIKSPGAWHVWFGQLTDAPDQGELSLWQRLAPYYLWALPQVMLPWAALLPVGLAAPFVRGPAELRNGRVLFWIFAAVFVSLSVTTHRRGYYMLPMFAVLAPLVAAGILDLARKALSHRRWSLVFRGTAFVLTVATGLLMAVLTHFESSSLETFVLSMCGILALLACGAWSAQSITVGPTPFKVLLWPFLAAGLFFVFAGGSNRLWGEGGLKKGEFAREVAKLVVAPQTVVLYGEEAGLITYALDRVTPEAASPEELATFIGRGPSWVLLPPSRLGHLPAGLDVREAARRDTGEKSEDRVLVLVQQPTDKVPG